MAQEPKDVLVRMNEELRHALEKAPEDRRWVIGDRSTQMRGLSYLYDRLCG